MDHSSECTVTPALRDLLSPHSDLWDASCFLAAGLEAELGGIEV